MQIAQLKCGESAKILGFLPGARTYRHQLLAMGLLPGTVFSLIRIAPLGDPVEIKVRGYTVSLRKQEAAILQLHKIPV
ncbi:MAG: FeoA family protein [Gammaproteobacteria bacterium]